MTEIASTPTAEDKRERKEKLREYHQAVLNTLGGPKARFVAKTPYVVQPHPGKMVAFFQNEITPGQDMFVEFVSKDYLPEDPERTLYRFKFELDYTTKYPKLDKKPGLDDRYLVSVSEFKPVSSVANTSNLSFGLPDPNIDLPVSELTIRDVAALLLKKPVSLKPWLNEIIEK